MRDLALTKLPGFEDDLFALPSRQLMEMTLKLLVEVKRGNLEGQPLGVLSATGDLSDCRKIYFDTDGTQKPRFRLVYRYTPNEIRAVAIEAVAVGKRATLSVYKLAATRLGRIPMDD